MDKQLAESFFLLCNNLRRQRKLLIGMWMVETGCWVKTKMVTPHNQLKQTEKGKHLEHFFSDQHTTNNYTLLFRH